MSSILFVLHDIGGAQLVYSYIVKEKIQNYLILAEGPALYPFEGISSDAFLSREEASLKIEQKLISKVITGTSWASDLEVDYIRLAKDHKIETVAFIDHWVNYRERFHYPKPNWESNLPDVLWAHDQKSFELLSTIFSNKKIELKENYYLTLNLKGLVQSNLKMQPNSFLILTEPIREHYGDKLGYDEYDAIELFWKKIKQISNPDLELKITIRPHPSERKVAMSKYGKFIERGASISSETEIFNDLYTHENVVGVDTIAMYYASKLNRKVFCSMPIAGFCNLPIEDVVYLRDQV